MGNRSDRVSYQQWDFDQLARYTGLSPSQVEAVHRDFMEAAGRDGQLDMKEFAQIYHRFPGALQQDPRYIERQIPRIFRTFDRDGSGALSFDEYLDAVIMMNHNVARLTRIDFLIQQNNGHGRRQRNEHISAQYGHQVLRRLNDYYGLPRGTEHHHWKQIDRRNRGYVTHEEFMKYIASQEAYNRRYQF